MKQSFGIVGGDQRQARLAQLLKADGNAVYTYGLDTGDTEEETSLDTVLLADVIILPLPLCKEDGLLNCAGNALSLEGLFHCLRPEQRVLAGMVKPQQQETAIACGIVLEDYFLREELTVANAAATAEAAIQVAMNQLDQTLLGMNCLVIGFGRIGKLLADRLRGLGVNVTATARKQSDLAWIRAYGIKALETNSLNGKLAGFDVVFNTVPSMILDRSLLRQLPQGCLCVDLASQQGIDAAAAETLGLPCLWARALPGSMKPYTAAVAIRDTIYNILLEGDLT